MGKKNVAYINGEMLKWAREQTPFLSTDMVELEKPKISSSNLSKWENGEDYAYSSGKMTMGEMCRILNVKSKHISGIEQAVMY